jgi:hypothetical protein
VEDETGLDKAVRLVIMLIMVVFDPLAVLLLIAANMSMGRNNGGKPIVRDGEITGLTPADIPVFTDAVKSEEEFFEKVKASSKKLDEAKVEIEKENIAEIKEEPIVLDEATGETIPPLTVHLAPGVYEEHHDEETKQKLQPKYDYDAEYAFKEKKSLDSGKF